MRTVEEINAFSRYGGDEKKPTERLDEFSIAMQFLLDREATTRFIEIGVRLGGSFRLWSHYFTDIKIGIDTAPPFDDMDSIDQAHEIQGSSHSPETVEKVKTILAGRLVDWLFIDGDHSPSPSGPEPDYNNYKQFVRPGGFIGFHDINHGGHQNIKNFWNKLSGEKFEMKIDDVLAGCGLGILIKV